ncbi:MAG: triose-phosphate isomerase [Armatimonadetes bacterium]|nr:triose-phosphate isomerase [Armatimonadota bacterium]NOG93914.1 triose-phosphate isomerase [Armatimonadota bacterium]
MQRRSLVAANWKMNLTVPEGGSVAQGILGAASKRADTDVVLCPSFTLLHHIREVVAKSNVKLGAQDVFWLAKGAFTGEVSVEMLRDHGCEYCIVGHSERRGRFGASELPNELLAYFSDNDVVVERKLRAVLDGGLTAILCIGETARERNEGRTDEVVASQLKIALSSVDESEIPCLAIAYEPIWAIGTGNVCEPDEAQRVCELIRSEVGAHMGSDAANTIRILYGGSVAASNCAGLFKQRDIDGALVGGASLKPDEFSRIILSA